MRQSEGKIDVSEIGSVLTNTKKMFEDFKVVTEEAKTAGEALKALAAAGFESAAKFSGVFSKV
jgi:hypothetical protein